VKTPVLQHGGMLIYLGQALPLYGEFLVLRNHNQFICLLLRVFSLANKLPHSLESDTTNTPFSLLSEGLSKAKPLQGSTKHRRKLLA